MKYLKFINFVLLLLQTATFVVIALILYVANAQFKEISEQRYGVDSALMNNAWLDFFTNGFFAVAIMLTGICVCYLALHVKDLKVKLSINSAAYLIYTSTGALLIYHLYVV
ncbi:hypothetical protein SG34_014225 [Thalassomonas viridans]|uniref:Uncharacterized protein n=1 Tax=Thalassomonas viridans TaxID=137584 RepID=A0AAE9ZAI5_9GAMM|nr:hypothetical protein [Thalassomonas viridans]WDE07937.1 hypothetical protein SG34_014225 [Thalassomonas viridans]